MLVADAKTNISSWIGFESIQRGVCVDRVVTWLRGEEWDGWLLFVFKRAITALLSTLLVGSIAGIPLFVAGIFEWRKQNLYLFKLLKGTQGLCEGETQIDRVREIFNQVSKARPSGIHYNDSGIEGRITGGNCSAMALEFASEYLRERGTLSSSLSVLAGRIRRLAEKYALAPTEDNPLVQEFRNRQKAFNCVEVDLSKSIDFSRAKIQSMANFHWLKVGRASPEFTHHKSEGQDALAREIAMLPKGVHLLRMILPSDNCKLEERGHSLVLIKEELGIFLYEPNDGVYLIRDHVAAEIGKFLKHNRRLFQLERSRFYTLEETWQRRVWQYLGLVS